MRSFWAGLFLLAGICGASAQQVVTNCVREGTSCPPSNQAVVSTVSGTNAATLAAVKWPRQLIYAQSNYTTNSTAGSRTVVLELVDGGNNVVGSWSVVPTLAASGSYKLIFLPGTYRETALASNNSVQTPFPNGLVVPPGDSLKIIDLAGIAAGDSQTALFQTIP